MAIVGARGFGRFHAQWYARLGCQVIAFVSSSAKTLKQNSEALRQVVPNFQGRGYDSLEQMLEMEKPDAVSICSPPHLHLDQVFLCLRHGVHVMCEKPLVWLGAAEGGEALCQAKRLVRTVEETKRIFAINTQYAAAWTYLADLFPSIGKSDQISLTIQARLKPQPSSPLDLWVDLGPHPLSLLFRIFPQLVNPPDRLEAEAVGQSLSLRFPVVPDGGPLVTLTVGRVPEPLERSLSWDGKKVFFEAHRDETGYFQTRLKWNGQEKIVEDLMQTSIRRFVSAVLGSGKVLCDHREALQQMTWLVGVVQKGVIS
ncbi:MAG: Gfo/Idh/MocA family oxidoreductase [Armatimonadetes bacterium]|nr:Gfo/Idh/MocA family oxidoreductase [Armatimonadota bacterium]MDW8122310.1 Gfo/Idh/MocA family oxidoreductase [Armatimonadota bacterium]